MSEPLKSLPLVFEQPRGRKKPPRHLADLSAEERTAAAETLGEPAFRIKQVANHYYARLERDPANMTDLPAASRDRIVEALLPTLLNPIRTMEADKGTTVKTLWKLFDGALVESVLMRYTDRADDLRLQPGRLWHGLARSVRPAKVAWSAI